MKKLVRVALLIATTLSAAHAHAATYVVNSSVQAHSGGAIGTAVGTISTDGTIGVLTNANITNFDITVSLSGFVRSFNKAKGWYNIVGNALSASESALSFDTELPGNNYFYFSSDTAYFPGVYSIYSNSGEGVQVYNVSVRSGPGGTVNFAQNMSAVPEPATWIAMILGFAGIGAGMRRRKPARVTEVGAATCS